VATRRTARTGLRETVDRATADRKKRILQVAERLFSHYGPAKTTMADIAKDVGIGVGTLYLDFSSKEEILEELQTDGGKHLANAMERAARGGETPEARIVLMLEARVRILLEIKDRGAHACDLIRCGYQGRFWKSQRPEGEDVARAFDSEVRTLLQRELALLSTNRTLTLSLDDATSAIEIAFAQLSPPTLFRYEPRHAATMAHNLARLVVFGLMSSSD
jgi:AcrR family transcriptional regulator